MVTSGGNVAVPQRLAVTTATRPSAAVVRQAQAIGEQWGLPVAARRNLTLARLRAERGVEGLIVCGPDGIHYATPREALRFHPSTAVLRIASIAAGRPDPMVEAMGLEPGMRVLDCTLGLATDAIVASFAVGENGRVRGLELSLPVYLVVSYGLAHYPEKRRLVREAMQRIEALPGDCRAVLGTVSAGDYQVIYFDPFFTEPVPGSAAIAPLRSVAEHGREALLEAIRLASRRRLGRVVVKGRRGEDLWEALQPARVMGGTRREVEYGVICE